jgi:hypothetical protein
MDQSWVFNRAMVWLEKDAGLDGPVLCYSSQSPLPLTGEKQVSRWYAGAGSTLANSAGGYTRFVKKGGPSRLGHACLPPLQFNVEQHPTALIEVAKATHPWRVLIVVKGREGLPLYAGQWRRGPGKETVDLLGLLRTKGYTHHFAELLFFMSTCTAKAGEEAEVEYRWDLQGRAAVIASLPVIRTAARAKAEGVPIAAVVVDEQAIRLGSDAVEVTAEIRGAKVKLQEGPAGVWKATWRDWPVGDYCVPIQARWKGSDKQAVSTLQVSITDGQFVGYDERLKLLIQGGKVLGPLSGSYRGKRLFKHPDTPQESLLCGQRDWDAVHSGRNPPDYGFHWWESHTEREIEAQYDYLAACGWTALHQDQWWMFWERLDCGGRLAPHGAEQFAKMLAAARRHGLRVYFNLSNHEPHAPAPLYAQYLEAGAKSADVRDPQSVFMRMYRGYAAQFAGMFRDETALLGVSAAGERDNIDQCGGAPFVNAVYDAYRARDPNHLFICEPHFQMAYDPNHYRKQGWKPVLGGFRSYFVERLDIPLEAATTLFKLARIAQCFMSEGLSWSDYPTQNRRSWGDLDNPRNLALYRLRCRQDLYTGLAYRLPIILTWDEHVVEDERIVFEQVRRLVDWSQPFRVPPLAVRVGQALLPPHAKSSAPLWQCEIALAARPLETVYVWEDEPIPAGVLHTLDARRGLPNLAFASEGGTLPDTLKDQMPLCLPEGMTANYSWNADGRTLLAFLRKKGQEQLVQKATPSECLQRLPAKPVGEVRLQNLPRGRLTYRLYDLASKKVVSRAEFDRSLGLRMPEDGWDFFLLVIPTT